MKILMVLTSHNQLGNTGRKTGIWLEEFAAPYFVFRDADVELTLESPKGGQPPLDSKSDMPQNQTPAMTRFKKDATAQKAFANTVKLADMNSEDFDTVFYSGGHGPMWDLAESAVSIALLESFYNSGKPIALVCHSPGVLRHVMYQGEPLVRAKRVSGFTNEEKEEMQLTHVVPFLVEDELRRLRAKFEKVPNWQPFSIVAGTGLIYLLRWFWWRINAWCEVVAMASSFLISITFFIMSKNGHPLPFANSVIYSVAFTSICWLLTAFISKPTSSEQLIKFYKKVHPAGPGWANVRKAAGVSRAEAALHGDHMGMATAGWISGCIVIWSSLFAIGNFLYSRWAYAAELTVAFVISGAVLLYVINNLWDKAPASDQPLPVEQYA